MNNKLYNFIAIGFVITFVNFGIYQQSRINDLTDQLSISDMRAKVNTEFADELLWLRINDVHSLNKENLIAQGRLEGVIAHINGDDKDVVENLWHEGYMRGLSQVDWEYDALSESNFERGYRSALEKAFPNGDYPSFINYPPRDVKPNAIGKPKFDSSNEGLKDNTELVDELNDKIKEVTNE
tara:strand:+ start:5173 stop:5718 length:546 start_codon:yes stop_codon:yes gene_type:complete